MAYSMIDRGYVSHLTGRTYTYTDPASKRQAMATMIEEDQAVRSAAQKRAQDAGVKRPLSDREIRKGDFVPDRRLTAERVADAALAKNCAHDPFATAAATIRAQQRLTDPPALRQQYADAIARLEEKSAALAQQRAAAHPPPDPANPVDKAAALRTAAAQALNSYAGTPAEREQNKRRADALLSQASVEEANAVAEAEHTARIAALADWVIDSQGSLVIVEGNPEFDQKTVNAVREMHARLKAGEATKEEWFALAEQVETERKQIKKSKLDALAEEQKRIESARESIRAGTDTTTPAETVADDRTMMERFIDANTPPETAA